MAPTTNEEVDHVSKKRKFNLESFDDIVHILIGPEKKLFRIYKEVLCKESTYFRAALKGKFKEAEEQKIEMAEEDVDTFSHFQYWLYSGNIITEDNGEKLDQNDDGKEWSMLVNLFIFAEARGIPGLQNAAIDRIIDKQSATETIFLENIHSIYENTHKTSPLRRLFVDFTHNWAHTDDENPGGSWFDSEIYDSYDKEFLFDLTTAYCRRVKGKIEEIEDFTAVRTNYHVPVPE